MARVSIEVSSMPTVWISACDRGVGEHERPGQRLGEVRVALEAAGGLAQHVDDPLGGGVARGSACPAARPRPARTRGRGRRRAGGSWRGSSGRACRGRRRPARRPRASGRRRSRPGWRARWSRRGSACGGPAARPTRGPRPSESSCCSRALCLPRTVRVVDSWSGPRWVCSLGYQRVGHNRNTFQFHACFVSVTHSQRRSAGLRPENREVRLDADSAAVVPQQAALRRPGHLPAPPQP